MRGQGRREEVFVPIVRYHTHRINDQSDDDPFGWTVWWADLE